MTLCLIGDCVNMSCPALVVILAWVGMFGVWLLLGIIGTQLTFAVMNILSGKTVKPEYILSIFGPIMFLVGLFLWIIAWIVTPILFGEVEKLKRKVGDGRPAQELIDESDEDDSEDEDGEDNVKDGRMANIFKPQFVAGDIVTGVPGNPDGYKHLYEGCKCRVLSIDRKGSMKLLLLDHVDREAQQEHFGETYTAPARNFVLFDKPKKFVRKIKSKKKKL